MGGRREFRGTLFAFDDVLNVEFLHTRKGFEQLNRQLGKLTRLSALEMIGSIDVRVSFTLMFLVTVLFLPVFFMLVLVMTMRIFLFVAVIICMLAGMFSVLIVQQRGGDLRFLHATTRLRVESKQSVTVFQHRDSLVQRGMVGLR